MTVEVAMESALNPVPRDAEGVRPMRSPILRAG
jgi:hypothetical protein